MYLYLYLYFIVFVFAFHHNTTTRQARSKSLTQLDAVGGKVTLHCTALHCTALHCTLHCKDEMESQSDTETDSTDQLQVGLHHPSSSSKILVLSDSVTTLILPDSHLRLLLSVFQIL